MATLGFGCIFESHGAEGGGGLIRRMESHVKDVFTVRYQMNAVLGLFEQVIECLCMFKTAYERERGLFLRN